MTGQAADGRALGRAAASASSAGASSPSRSCRRAWSSKTAFRAAWADPAFHAELDAILRDYGGRPTPVTECQRLSERLGVRVLLKREDLAHTGLAQAQQRDRPGAAGAAHGQGPPHRRDRRRPARRGGGHRGGAVRHGAVSCTWARWTPSARSSTCSAWSCSGPRSAPCEPGSRTLKDAVNEALRDWVANVADTHYCLGSVMGPHPYPWMVRELQRVVGDEAREQCRALLDGDDPDWVVACIGGGSNAAGTFAGFVDTGAVARGGRGGRAVRRWAGACPAWCTA